MDKRRGEWTGESGQEEKGNELVGNYEASVFTCCTNETGSVNIGSINDRASCESEKSNL